jgi:hypothetical protein
MEMIMSGKHDDQQKHDTEQVSTEKAKLELEIMKVDLKKRNTPFYHDLSFYLSAFQVFIAILATIGAFIAADRYINILREKHDIEIEKKELEKTRLENQKGNLEHQIQLEEVQKSVIEQQIKLAQQNEMESNSRKEQTQRQVDSLKQQVENARIELMEGNIYGQFQYILDLHKNKNKPINHDIVTSPLISAISDIKNLKDREFITNNLMDKAKGTGNNSVILTTAYILYRSTGSYKYKQELFELMLKNRDISLELFNGNWHDDDCIQYIEYVMHELKNVPENEMWPYIEECMGLTMYRLEMVNYNMISPEHLFKIVQHFKNIIDRENGVACHQCSAFMCFLPEAYYVFKIDKISSADDQLKPTLYLSIFVAYPPYKVSRRVADVKNKFSLGSDIDYTPKQIDNLIVRWKKDHEEDYRMIHRHFLP